MINTYVNNVLIKCIHIEVGIIIYVYKFISKNYLFVFTKKLWDASLLLEYFCVTFKLNQFWYLQILSFSSKNNFVYKRSYSKNIVKK